MAEAVLPARPGVSVQVLVLAAIGAASLASALALDLSPARLIPAAGGLDQAKLFFAHALRPALAYQDPSVPAGTTPLLLKAAEAAWQTVIFAAAAVSMSVLLGLLLGFAGSTAWWRGDLMPAVGGGQLFRRLAPALYAGTRLLIALMRSVHELLWAVLFLAALGLSELSAVIAIAIPYSGTLAKVFAELIDEAPRDAAYALRAAGASPWQVFAVGLLPRALPDLTAYVLYRFECALRSSAVLGFFGYPTLGYYISASFENLHYGEVWTYLYAMLLLVVVADRWSGAVRRRLVA